MARGSARLLSGLAPRQHGVGVVSYGSSRSSHIRPGQALPCCERVCPKRVRPARDRWREDSGEAQLRVGPTQPPRGRSGFSRSRTPVSREGCGHRDRGRCGSWFPYGRRRRSRAYASRRNGTKPALRSWDLYVLSRLRPISLALGRCWCRHAAMKERLVRSSRRLQRVSRLSRAE